MKKQTDKKAKERPSVREFDLAWKEFFKGKSEPKNEKEEKKQFEDFIDWYNNVRKQSDTGKTPAQMYKEIYGEESNKGSAKPSRITHFEWDDDYKEPHEMLQEADALISKGKYEKALKLIDLVLGIVGEDEEALMMKAEILNNLDRFDEAEKCLKKVDKNENFKAYASFYRSHRYLNEGNFSAALKYIREAYEQEPDNYDFVIGLANYFYLQNDKYYIEYVEKAKKIDKKRTEKFLKKFWLEPKEFMQGPFVLVALNCVEKLMSRENFIEAEENLSFLLMYEHYLDKEIIPMIRGLQIECLAIMGKMEEAAIKVEELIKVNNKNPHAYFYKAQLFYKHSKLDEALKQIDICLKFAEKKMPHPDFYRLKSMILMEMDNDEYIYYEKKADELEKGRQVLVDAYKEFFDENLGSLGKFK